MSSRFSTKRVHKGRIELFDPEQDRWIPLAMVSPEERRGMDELPSEAAPDLETTKHQLSKLDAGLLMGAAATDSQRKPSRATGMMLGLIIGLVLVAVLVFVLG